MRRIVVTGGGTGIGRAVAEEFAADAEVYVIGRRKEILDRVVAGNSTGRIRAVAADLTDVAQVRRVAAEIATDPVDVLVNNAGGLHTRQGPGLEETADLYRRTLESNLLSAVLLTEALWPRLRRPGGRVVNIGSIAAHRGSGAYAAAKAALYGWAFGLARSGGPDGITVNTVAPGYVQDTEFFDNGRSPRHDQLVAETLVKRAGVPTDVASAVRFLAAAEASWITGQVLGVNGGALLG